MEFDHESAWFEVAKPAFEALPKEIKTLFSRVSVEMADARQNKQLNLDWPVDGELKAAFQWFDSLTIAKAAQAIHDCGHWGSSKQGRAIGWPEKAQSWKFSLLADQILCERSGLVRGDHPKGISFAIHEGTLRVCCSGHDYWVWEEIGPGTPENLNRAKVIMADGTFQFYIQRYEANIPKAKAELWNNADPFKDVGERYSKTRFTIDTQKSEAQTIEERENLKAKMQEDLDQEVANRAQNGQKELTVKFWLIDHGIPLDHFIWYDHTKKGCFGWMESRRLSKEDAEILNAKMMGAFFDFEIKTY